MQRTRKHWKGIYLHCVHPRYCVRLYLWGCDWHKKAKYALEKPDPDVAHGERFGIFVGLWAHVFRLGE